MTVATVVLRLLLDRRDPPPADAPWDEWAGVLQRNAVLLRVADRLQVLGQPLPPRLAAAFVHASARSERVLELMRHAADACERHGIPYVFPKALPHHPDVGGDIDLLVPRATDVDPLIVGDLGAALQGPGLWPPPGGGGGGRGTRAAGGHRVRPDTRSSAGVTKRSVRLQGGA